MLVRLTHAPARPLAPVYAIGPVLCLGAFFLAKVLGAVNPVQWAGVGFLPAGLWGCVVLHRLKLRVRQGHLISTRLARLPDEFTVLNGLEIPAPWGMAHVDHLILSRYGLVVVADGPSGQWMLEQVEAVRSLLFTEGLAQGSMPVRPLVLIPPGTPDTALVESDAPVVRVEQIRLKHVAPSQEPVLTSGQVQALVRHFLAVSKSA